MNLREGSAGRARAGGGPVVAAEAGRVQLPARVLLQVEERHVRRGPPGESVHGERANFTGLLLGCIKAKFCK